jgi:hypothetical protein
MGSLHSLAMQVIDPHAAPWPLMLEVLSENRPLSIGTT